ncbi:MAG: tetratricopeptide repeat protein [Cyanobacteriota bacterium]|nr:tetratricopeptide repeat protein [Cyanobacteriota bacterium]
MKLINQTLSLLGVTAILATQASISLAQDYPLSSPTSVHYIAKISAQDLVNRAVAKAQSGDNQGAIADLTEALQLKPDYAQAYHYRGIVRSAMGDKSGAIVDFQSAADLFQKQEKVNDYQQAILAIQYLQRSQQ